MQFINGICTDIGISGQVNQDAALTCRADTHLGEVCMAVLCDGMGGLEQGDLASATVFCYQGNEESYIY